MKLRIKVFKDGSENLQFLEARCGKKEVWTDIPRHHEEESEDNEEYDIWKEREDGWPSEGDVMMTEGIED